MRKIVSAIIVGLLIALLIPFLGRKVYAATNPYGKYQDADGDGYQEIRCTWYAWQKAYDVCGVALPGWGNAKTWLASAQNAGYATGSEARVNSIAVFNTGTYGHVSFVTAVNGDKMTVVEGGNTLLDHTSSEGVGQSNPSSVVGVGGLIGFIYLGNSGPLTAQLSVERKRYNSGDIVTFYFGGENTSGTYTLAIYKEFDKYKTVTVNSNYYSIQLDDIASYSAYMTSYGISGGYADSNWVDWKVLPLTAEMSADKTKCNAGDIVTLTMSGNNNHTFANKELTLGVWRDGTRIVSESTNSDTYSVNCTEPGEYSAYFTAYGGGTFKDSNRVTWTAYPLTAELSVDKTKCKVNENVTLTFGGYNNNTFSNGPITLAIWRDGEYVVHQNVTGQKYVITCDQPGKYTSYMTAYGGGTYKDSNWVEWTVSKECTNHTYNDGIITSFPSCTQEGTKTFTCTVCGETKTESIPKTQHTKIVVPGKSATCTETGLTEGSKCSICGEILIEQEVIPAKGHNYGDWVVTKEATIDEEGLKEKVCATCGNHVTETIPKVVLTDGWIKDSSGTWYYYTNSIKATGWKQIGGKWYLFDNSGAMLTDWQKVNGVWYYMNASGAMATGWVKDGNTWYYMNSSGAMVTGWQKIGGVWYYFKSSGAMAANEWCDGYWLNANGSWTYQPRGSWKQDSTGWWFGDTSGWYAKSTTQKIDSVNYTFNAAGYWVQ